MLRLILSDFHSEPISQHHPHLRLHLYLHLYLRLHLLKSAVPESSWMHASAAVAGAVPGTIVKPHAGAQCRSGELVKRIRGDPKTLLMIDGASDRGTLALHRSERRNHTVRVKLPIATRWLCSG
jgi:hypothetical protein